MALPIQLTPELIHETADQLQNEGIRPTLANVRDRLGGGSFTTISEAMKLWKSEKQETAQLARVTLPDDIASRLHSLGAEMWETAQTIASDRLKIERDSLEQQREQMNNDLDDLQTVVRVLEKEKAELLADNETISRDLATANTKVTEFSNANSELVQRNAHLKLEIEQERERVNALSNDLATSQERYEQLLQDLTKSAIENAKLQGQNETLAKFEVLTQTQAGKIEQLTADLATAKALTHMTSKEEITADSSPATLIPSDSSIQPQNTPQTPAKNKGGRSKSITKKATTAPNTPKTKGGRPKGSTTKPKYPNKIVGLSPTHNKIFKDISALANRTPEQDRITNTDYTTFTSNEQMQEFKALLLAQRDQLQNTAPEFQLTQQQEKDL